MDRNRTRGKHVVRPGGRDDMGSVPVEYALLVTLFAIVGLATLYTGGMGAALKSTFSTIANAV